MVKCVKGSKNKKDKNMGFFEWANSLVKKMDWLDVKLVAVAGMLIGIILVKLFPAILEINIWLFVLIALLCLFKVYYVIFFRKE